MRIGARKMSPMEALARRENERPKLEVRTHLSVPNMGNTPPRMLLNEDAFVSMLSGAPPRGTGTKPVRADFGGCAKDYGRDFRQRSHGPDFGEITVGSDSGDGYHRLVSREQSDGGDWN